MKNPRALPLALAALLLLAAAPPQAGAQLPQGEASDTALLLEQGEYDPNPDLPVSAPGYDLAFEQSSPVRTIGLLVLLGAGLLGAALGAYRKSVARRLGRHVYHGAADEDLPPLLFLAPDQAPPPVRPAAPPVRAAAAPTVPAASPPSPPPAALEEIGEEVQVGTARFHRPPEGTLQLLPGRLEILVGNERVEEIRFVRVPGRDTVITFGRAEGEPHLHVQLRAPTVSRMHALMQFRRDGWSIANLSHTNPIVVNGQPLREEGDAVVLEDCDEIEMGEMVFRFRNR